PGAGDLAYTGAKPPSSRPFSSLMRANARSRSASLATSPRMVVTFLPMSLAAAASAAHLAALLGTRSGRVKNQAADFDALARQNVRWCSRIVEGGVRREAGPPVGERIEALEQQRFIPLHLWDEEPSVRWVVGDAISLARAIGVDEIRWH